MQIAIKKHADMLKSCTKMAAEPRGQLQDPTGDLCGSYLARRRTQSQGICRWSRTCHQTRC